MFKFQFWCSVQYLIPNVRQMVFAHISVKGWIIDPYKYCLFDCSWDILVFTSHYSKFVDVDIVTWGVTVVKYWWRGLLMLFEPFCKGSARFSNVSFSTPLFIALISVYDSTLAVNGIIFLGNHEEAFDGLSSFKMYLYPIFATSFLYSLLRPWWYGTTMYKFWLLLLPEPFWFVVVLCFCWGSGCSILLCLWPMWGTCISLMHWTDVVLLHATMLDLSLWWLLYGTRYQPHCIWMVCCGSCPIAGINQCELVF